MLNLGPLLGKPPINFSPVDREPNVATAQSNPGDGRSRINAVDQHAGVLVEGIECFQILEHAGDNPDVTAGDLALLNQLAYHPSRHLSQIELD